MNEIIPYTLFDSSRSVSNPNPKNGSCFIHSIKKLGHQILNNEDSDMQKIFTSTFQQQTEIILDSEQITTVLSSV
tara:strand:+ start:575 stop:799 length:225 start_codon:yes stop_codon:yes gene_type:complete